MKQYIYKPFYPLAVIADRIDSSHKQIFIDFIAGAIVHHSISFQNT